MLDFITIPVVVGIVTLGIFKLFELFARRKERIMFIEKMSENIDFEKFNTFYPQLSNFKINNFSSLKFGCLLSGLGLGLLIGFILIFVYDLNDYQLKGLAIGSSVLFTGGLGLLISFFVEQHYRKKNNGDKLN